MNESRLSTIAQIEEFLLANAVVEFLPQDDDTKGYTDVSRVLKRFDYSGRRFRECALAALFELEPSPQLRAISHSKVSAR